MQQGLVVPNRKTLGLFHGAYFSPQAERSQASIRLLARPPSAIKWASLPSSPALFPPTMHYPKVVSAAKRR